MSYLKIFPKLVVAKLDDLGDYVGEIAYDFEHYGHMSYDNATSIQLQCHV
jgi:hypothetical protein